MLYTPSEPEEAPAEPELLSEPPEAAEKGGKAWMCCWHLEFFSFLRDLF